MIGSQLQKYLDEQFIGQDPNYRKVGRDIFKTIKDAYKEKLGYIPLKPMALLEATEKNSKVLKGISCSEPNDLIVNNFGIMMASCINTGSDVQRDIVDEVGVTRDIHFQENQNLRMAFATQDNTPGPALSLGGAIEIGWGDIDGLPWNPTRADFQLRQRFALVPQANLQNPATPTWVSLDQEAIVVAQVNGVNGNGVVGECGMFCWLRIGFSTGRALMMISHDKTGLPFNNLDNIRTTYTWSLS